MELRFVDTLAAYPDEIELLRTCLQESRDRSITRIVSPTLDGSDRRLREIGALGQRALRQSGAGARGTNEAGGGTGDSEYVIRLKRAATHARARRTRDSARR